MYQLLVTTLFATSVLAAGPISLPSTFNLCSRSDPKLNDCLKPAIQAAFPELVKGVRTLGVLPLDPLQVSSLGIDQGTGPVAIKLDFKDLLIHGISKATVESVDAKLTEDVKTLEIKIRTDEVLRLVGKYTIAGKVLVLDISGTGDSEINFFGTTASILLTGHTVVKDGITYLIFTSANFDLNPKTASVNFRNLFNGDKALGDNMNKFLNENWDDVFGELKDPIQKAFAATVIEIANRMFSKVPYDKIFLP